MVQYSYINCYAPTEVKDNKIKNIFYDRLDIAYDFILANNIKILLGDFNADIGQ